MLKRTRWGGIKTVLVAFPLISTILFLPLTLPILPVESYIEYAKKVGISGVKGENHEFGILPQHFADMFGWEEMVGEVARVFNSLSPEEQEECAIFTGNYGEAGAVDLLGKKYGLPVAISGHNSYYFWGTRNYSGEIVIYLGGMQKDLMMYFDEVFEAGSTNCGYCMPYENNLPIFICRGLKGSFSEFWLAEKSFG